MTLLLGSTSSMLPNLYLYKKTPYGRSTDLTPLVRVAWHRLPGGSRPTHARRTCRSPGPGCGPTRASCPAAATASARMASR